MSHDIEASYAATELVSNILSSPANCFSTTVNPSTLSGYAAREGRLAWPHADGVVKLSIVASPAPKNFSLAVEFKRQNEGLHGVLTAIGQSQAYIQKGYSGAIIVVPDQYPSFPNVGAYVAGVLNQTSPTSPIGVYTYSAPNLGAVSPFAGKLTIHRPLQVDVTASASIAAIPNRTETQWAHIREGSTEPDAFFKYLQSVKSLASSGNPVSVSHISTQLAAAAKLLAPSLTAEQYLSSTSADEFSDRAWRQFWFSNVLHPGLIEGWVHKGGTYVVNDTLSKVLRLDGKGPKKFFSGKSNSPKNKLVVALNKGSITLSEATKKLAENYHSRAHSYREDIDSGCDHLGFVDSSGRLTDAGYAFVDACERYGNPNEGIPRAMFLSALIREGAVGAFLHYIHQLSEERFSADPLAFSSPAKKGKYEFKPEPYLQWLEDQLVKRLRVMRKSSARGGVKRKPFQGEFAVLRGLGIISGFRVGVGLIINWPQLQEAVTFEVRQVY